jgi:uncharacterized protein YecE (DUF72 family)
MRAIIGTAGWRIPGKNAGSFGAEGPALQRYATRFAGVEINSSFHRPHRAATWERWAASVPDDFRFAVKMPKAISHDRRLADCADPLERFLGEAGALGDKLGVLLLQLPPKLAFDQALAENFLGHLGSRTVAQITCEPRHPSWFEGDADALLERLRVARVAADPAIVPQAALPGGWRGFHYSRLHGSPVIYRSSYEGARLDHYARLIDAEIGQGRPTWCIFDNTASSAATTDALALAGLLRRFGH